MCVILVNQKNKIKRSEIIAAWMVNPDGGGAAREGGSQIKKFKTLNSMLKWYDQVPNNCNVVLHFRISTGGIGLHPFKIPCTPFYLFHNGICGSSRNGKPDTRILAERLRGMDISDILAALIFLNKKGKGKFTVCTVDLSYCKSIGFTFRSNENHLNLQKYEWIDPANNRGKYSLNKAY